MADKRKFYFNQNFDLMNLSALKRKINGNYFKNIKRIEWFKSLKETVVLDK